MSEMLGKQYYRIQSYEKAMDDLSFILFGETGREATAIVAAVRRMVAADTERDYHQPKSKRPLTLRELVEENSKALDLELRKATINAADAGYHRLTLIFAEMFNLLQNARETYPLNGKWKENERP